MKQNKVKLSGEEGFDSYYTDIYGSRWTSLKASLFGESQYALLNAGGTDPYYLDPGSVCAALTLPVEGGKKLLDLCAAPGGKTLVISSIMDSDAHLSSNERSPDRKARLAKVVSDCLPEEISSRVLTSCSDGATWCRRETESFDRILLDVPCSSERHVVQDLKYLKDWSPSRIKSLSMEQWALLSSAWRLLKPQGYMVYSTCALAPQENDEVLRRLNKKFDNVQFASREEVSAVFARNSALISSKLQMQSEYSLEEIFNNAEKTEFGFHVMPDTDFGAGPLFFALIKKTSQNVD